MRFICEFTKFDGSKFLVSVNEMKALTEMMLYARDDEAVDDFHFHKCINDSEEDFFYDI